MSDKLVLDLETKQSFDEVGGFHNTAKLDVSLCGVYSYERDQYRAFKEPEFAELGDWLKSASLIIGFNSKSFDFTVLQKYYKFKLSKLPHLDILKELSHFFLETEKHHAREEKAIFPRLKAHGVIEPPLIFEEDHVEFMARKKVLNELALAENKGDYREFLGKISPVIEFLTTNLTDHIYKEDNILYPMAYETLDKDEWKEVRKKFDAIGYCCFAPADLKKKKRS